MASWIQLSWRNKPPGGEDTGYFEGPPGNKVGSAPGQSKSPSVRRTRRYDFELESSREEKDRAYMHDSQNRDTGMGAGYASPRGQGLLHSGSYPVRGGMRSMIIVET